MELRQAIEQLNSTILEKKRSSLTQKYLEVNGKLSKKKIEVEKRGHEQNVEKEVKVKVLISSHS